MCPRSIGGNPLRAVVLLSEEREAAALRVVRLTKTSRSERIPCIPIIENRCRCNKKKKRRARLVLRQTSCRDATLRKEKDRDVHKELKNLTEKLYMP